MKKYYSKIETKGLPGGPNEQFTYITGIFSSDVFSTEGYKRNSPDKNNPYNIIPSGNITMEGVDFPVMGMDNLGNTKAMMPGNDYKFPGDMVFETPMYKRGGGLLTKTMKCNSCGWSWKAADGGNDVTTCHKCGGEALPKAQGGGSKNKEPIIVPPGDPRVQAYADSLTLYNQGRRDANTIESLLKDKGYLTWDEYFKAGSGINPSRRVPGYSDAWLRIMELNQENPDFGRGTRKIQFPVRDDIASTPSFKDYHLYAKPVQPVKVDPDKFDYVVGGNYILSDGTVTKGFNEWKPKRTTPDPNRSVADNLKIMGQDTSFSNRKKLAEQAGIPDYKGTAEQNVALNKWLHEGKLNPSTENKTLTNEQQPAAWEQYTESREQPVEETIQGEQEEKSEDVVIPTNTTPKKGQIDVPSWKQVWVDDPNSPVGGYWKKVYTGTKTDVSPPIRQAGGPAPILIDDPSDPRLHNYLDSLNLYKGHQKQLQLNPEGNKGFVADRNKEGLGIFYQGSIGKDPNTRYHSNVNTYIKGETERDKMLRKYGIQDGNNLSHEDWKAAWETMEKDPEYDKWWDGMVAATNMKTFADPRFGQSSEDIQLAKYYDKLTFYNPAATGYWDTPDLGHSTIMPTEKYLGNAWNPVYAKPVQPYKYTGDPRDLEKYRDKPLISGTNREWEGGGSGSMVSRRTTPDPNRSVADNLKLMGEDTSFTNRKKLFLDAGLGDTYTGTAEQNILLNKWLHDGRPTNTTEETVQDNPYAGENEFLTAEPYEGSTNDATLTNTNNEQTTQESIVDENEGEGTSWYWGYDSEWIPDDGYPGGGYQKRIKRKIPIEGSAPQYQTGGEKVKGRAARSTRPNQKKQLTTTPKLEKPLTTNEDQILTYKDNADWFDSRAVYHDNPQYDNLIRKRVYSGNYGYNPATGAVVPLKKEDQVEISDEIKNILDLQQEKIDERDRVRAMSPEDREAYRRKKFAASLRAEGRRPITIDEIGGGSNPLLREEDKTGRRPWEGKAGQTLFLTPEEIEAYNKDWVAKSMVAVGENPLFYAPGIIAGGAALPALGEVAFAGAAPYFSAPITVAGTTIPGATAGNLINAGFAGHGLYNVGPDAIDFATNPSWEGAGNLAMDALEIAPIAGSAVRGTVEGYNAAKQVANKLGNKYLPNAYKHNPWAFKTNPEAYYRQVSKEAIDDAFINKLIREKGEEVTPENYKKFQSQLKDLAGTNEYKNYEEKYRAMAVANSHGPMPYFQRGELFYGNRPTLKVRKKEIPLKERKVVNLDYLIESNYKPEAFQNSYGYKMNLGNPEEIGSVGVLKPDPNLRSLENFNIYKRDWWKGYKPIDTPKQLPGSPNAPTSWFNGKRQNALLVEQARRSGEAPLPDYMTPYISRRYTPATKQQEIFESFLLPETQEKLRELRTQRFTREGPASNEYQQGGEIIPEDVKNMKAALDKELKAVKNYNLTPEKKNKLIQELYTTYNESVPPKFQLGGPVLSAELQMYKDYITGKDESPEAVKNYDKLNRIHYKKAKANNMSPANYIMTELIS